MTKHRTMGFTPNWSMPGIGWYRIGPCIVIMLGLMAGCNERTEKPGTFNGTDRQTGRWGADANVAVTDTPSIECDGIKLEKFQGRLWPNARVRRWYNRDSLNRPPNEFNFGEDELFYQYLQQADTETDSLKRGDLLAQAYHIYPEHIGLRERVIAYGRNETLMALIHELQDVLRGRDLEPVQRLYYTNCLYYAYYVLGDFTNAYSTARSVGKFIDQVPNDLEKARWINNLGTLNLLHAGTINMYADPALPVHCTDYRRSRGMYQAARCYAPWNNVVAQNERLLSRAEPLPFPSGCNGAGHTVHQRNARMEPDAKGRKAFCDTVAFPFGYELLYDHLDRYDEILFVHDLSGSMDTVTYNTMGMTRNRLANKLLSCLTFDLQHKRLGLVTVEGYCADRARFERPIGAYDTTYFREIQRCLVPFGATPLVSRLDLSTGSFTKDPKAKRIIFILSDGVDRCTGAFDLCDVAKAYSRSGVDISIMHFLTNDPVYERFVEVYECMTASSRSPMFRMSAFGSIEEVPAKELGVPFLALDDVLVLDELSASELTKVRGQDVVGIIRPDHDRWTKANVIPMSFSERVLGLFSSRSSTHVPLSDKRRRVRLRRIYDCVDKQGALLSEGEASRAR